MDFDHYKNWNLHKCCDYIPIVRAYKLVMGTLCPQNVMYVIQYRARLCMEKKKIRLTSDLCRFNHILLYAELWLLN